MHFIKKCGVGALDAFESELPPKKMGLQEFRKQGTITYVTLVA
jgi:hypothetical protein